MATSIIGNPASSVKPQSSAAANMAPAQRKTLARRALLRQEPLSTLAREYGVSRKFVRLQSAKAERALEAAFSSPADETSPLFSLPVTKGWIRSFVISSVLGCHAPYRGIAEVLRDLFGYKISLGSIHNIVHEAVVAAGAINAREDLSNVRVGAHDEIFQGNAPVLTGIDVDSFYCYLLSLEDHRDGDTWGIRLLDLRSQGLQPDHTIADFGGGLRAGQAEAWPDVPCHGDVFHGLQEVGKLAVYLENRALGAINARDKLERKMERSKKKARGHRLSKRLGNAREAEKGAVELADDIAVLASWLRDDVLALVGPEFETRRRLFDFIVEELKQREELAAHRIAPVRKLLENQRDSLLAFVAKLDQRLDDLARSFRIEPQLVRSVYELHGLDECDARRYQRQAELRKSLRHAFYPVDQAVKDLLKETVRASSLVENLNGRLRNYFFLRRQLGPDYLDLLRFYLNHHRFQRSERPERQGRSPAEILTGKSFPHWLAQLGLELRAAA